jgi:hypothetical protein
MGQRLAKMPRVDCGTARPVRREWQSLRLLGVIAALSVSGCSTSSTTDPAPVYVAPSAPTRAAVILGLSRAVAEEKLTRPIEMSDLRKVELGGMGSYFVCLREANPSSGKQATYSVFYDNDDYKGVRASVIFEHCETQQFTQVDLPPPKGPEPSPSASPSPSPSHRHGQH